MTAGLPGTGIGGLYYLVLVILMPAREAYLTARGHSSRARWQVVLRHVLLGGGIIAALFALGWMIQSLFAMLMFTAFGPSLHRMVVNATTVLNRHAIVMTLSLLFGVLLLATLWQLIDSAVPERNTPAPVREIAEPRVAGSNSEVDKRAA